jgi:hypothetical protein
MHRTYLLLLAGCLSAACGGPRMGAVTFAADYRPSEIHLTRPLPPCVGPIQVLVSDARTEPAVGYRFQEGRPQVRFPIWMQGALAPSFQAGLHRVFQHASAFRAGRSPVQLHVAVTRLFIEESIFNNSEFDGWVDFDAMVLHPASSQPCWAGHASGFAENYGRAGNPENYQETLSTALERATINLLGEPGFVEALCGRCSAAPAAQP